MADCVGGDANRHRTNKEENEMAPYKEPFSESDEALKERLFRFIAESIDEANKIGIETEMVVHCIGWAIRPAIIQTLTYNLPKWH